MPPTTRQKGQPPKGTKEAQVNQGKGKEKRKAPAVKQESGAKRKKDDEANQDEMKLTGAWVDPAEEQGACEDSKIPVTVLTGFLGSGKTTLLNHILTAMHGKKLAIIENEFGEVGIDDALLAKNAKLQAEEELIEMMNGCICCTVRQDLIVVLKKLFKRVKSGKLHLDGIVIETTGLADPAPVAQTFFVDETVKEFCRLDGIVTLVDAKHIEQHLDEEKPEGVENEAVEQVAFADRLLLNKTDLVSEADLQRVEKRLKSINSTVPIQRCSKSQVSVDSVLGIRGFDLKRTLEMDPEFLNVDGEHEHDSSVTSVCLTQPGDVDLELVQEWIATTLETRGTNIFRMKGVLSVEHFEQKFVYQGVHMVFDGAFQEEEWAEEEERGSKLIFIGRELDPKELKQHFAQCKATPALRKKKLKQLRFKVGDKVDFKIDGKWQQGKVAKQLYREVGMPPGFVAPYQIEMADGDLVFAPSDTDDVVREP